MTEPLTTDNAILRHKIKCKYSGLIIGVLEVQTLAGALPYLSHWDECIAYHPLFSLAPQKLFQFTRHEWERHGQAAVDIEISAREAETLGVAFLAMLHTLDCIKQDVPALPPLSVVQSCMGKLFNLAYWKWRLESKRFRFPTLHISKYNNNSNFSNVGDYLDLCFDIRRDYELSVREAEEKEKIRVAEAALVALNSTWVTPTSKKLLWQWVRAHLPEKYQPDAEGWLGTLFLGGSNAIVEFDKDELELAEEIIVSSCPVGTGVLHAVRARLEAIKQVWSQHYEAFDIELDQFAPNRNVLVNGERIKAPHPGPEPQLVDFQFNRTKFLIAHAKWQIAKAAYLKDGGIL